MTTIASTMSNYVRRVRNFSFDIKLFLLYNLLANIGFGAIELIFNFYLLEIGYREDFIGEWRAVQTISMAVAAASIGFWINRYGPWKVIFAGFAVFSVSSVLLGLSENRWLLYLLAIIFGVGLSCLFNPLMPFVMEYGRPEERQYVAAISFSLISLSLMIGSLVGGFSPSLVGRLVGTIEAGSLNAYRAAILAGAAIAATGMIPLLMMKEPRRPWKPPRHDETAQSNEPLARKRTRWDVGVFVLAGGLMSIGVGMVQPFFNVYLRDLGASANQVGFIFALGGLTAAVIGLTAPVIANRLGALNAILLLRIAIVPFYLALLFIPSIGVAVLAFLVRQATISMAWPVDSTFISEVLPPRSRAGVFGLRSSAWNAGFALASYVAGRIIVSHGYDWTFVSMVFFSAIAAIIFNQYYTRHPAVTSGSLPSAFSARKRAQLAVSSSTLGSDVGESNGSVRAPASQHDDNQDRG
jgi:MFS family permease